MKKLLLIALLLGLIKARTLLAEYPPLPPDRGAVPYTDAPGTVEKPLFAAWSFEVDTFDVLEMSSDAVTWSDLPGPYEVRPLDGQSSYYVRVPVGYAKAFFRVRRVWGNPWVN